MPEKCVWDLDFIALKGGEGQMRALIPDKLFVPQQMQHCYVLVVGRTQVSFLKVVLLLMGVVFSEPLMHKA